MDLEDSGSDELDQTTVGISNKTPRFLPIGSLLQSIYVVEDEGLPFAVTSAMLELSRIESDDPAANAIITPFPIEHQPARPTLNTRLLFGRVRLQEILRCKFGMKA